MTVTDSLQFAVSLEELLAARDLRAARQVDWLTRHRRPLISLTLVTPGPVKDSARYRRSMRAALAACDALLRARGWPVLERAVFWPDTGPEAFWAVDHAAVEIKAATVALEQEHALGRLWDIDVFSPDVGVIGRRSLDRPGRPCLLCDQPAHACARSRRHGQEELTDKIEGLLDGYFARR
ncbi:citrate lyase holo-[acyl-carrier protein] synthase [Acerihabitans arboris]|uniref:Apo-citrate lyase phosphoribosyl-dephospho-CoA transferase n=1 Tax=Acerihabitans arboris TaxID=2691583 RepID=A0A845SHS5_9GAMM|nr:citrate lyase holo-[acyl-carrier protein] synthase [Acerihabitans arboris]NDL63439.1 citrate lyase holo-[acyl-carrier protein] synthase [Acerihabitans arboris]